jgi:RimJ/RimL family protein N-acetyltransferase
MGDAEASRFIGGPQARSVAWRGLLQVAGAWAVQGFSMFSVIEAASGCWIGRLGPWFPEGWPGREVGWAIIPQAQGRGYATEGSAAAMDWAFDHLNWDAVIHSIAPDNSPSQAVARKLGAQNTGPGRMPPPYEDHRVDIWSQTRAQWRARLGGRTSR